MCGDPFDACEAEPVDPTPRYNRCVEVRKNGISLRHPDFLVYLATAPGGKALRNLMIPCLIKSRRELKPDDNITKACDSTHRKITQMLKAKYPHLGTVPKYESTLAKDFRIGQDFS